MIVRANASKDTLRSEVRQLKQHAHWLYFETRKHEKEIAKLNTEGVKNAKRLVEMETRLKQK